MMISTAFLKRGAAKGLNLFQIANLLCRAKSFKSKGASTSKPSPVEVVATRLPSTKSRYFLSWLEMELDKLIESTYSTTVKKDTKSKQRAQEAQRRQYSVPRFGAQSRLGSSMSSSNLAPTLPPPSPGPGLTLRPPRSHARSNSSILELDADLPGLGFGSSFGPLKRNYSHEALATLG